jgi:hypothetical protein
MQRCHTTLTDTSRAIAQDNVHPVGLLLILAALPIGIVLLVGGAMLSERTRWGYGVMVAGIGTAAYGLMMGAFLFAFAHMMNFD